MSSHQQPQLSIVIPAYNEEKHIESAIDSIKDQNLDIPYEIIVVDNACTDKTAELAKKKGAVIVHESEQGLTFARQAGLKAARGSLLIYMDADTRLPKGWVDEVLSYFAQNHDVVGMSCSLKFYDVRRMHEKFYNWFFQGIGVPVVLAVLRFSKKPEVLLGPAIALRRQALVNAGGIDTNFIFYGEDTSLAYTLHTQGKVVFRRDLFVQTSARRYHAKGAMYVLFLYFSIFILIHMGLYNEALYVSNRYAEKHHNLYNKQKKPFFSQEKAFEFLKKITS